MKKLAVLVVVFILSGSAFAQLKSGKLITEDVFDTPPTSLSEPFLPADFSTFLASVPAVKERADQATYSKRLATTGWLLKKVFLKEKFDDFGYNQPVISMADFDTRSVSEYNALHSKYSIFFN